MRWNSGPLGVTVFVLLASAFQFLSAQDDVVSEQVWLDYNPRWVLPSNLGLQHIRPKSNFGLTSEQPDFS